MKPRAYCSWSGGKDAALALYRSNDIDIDCLLTNISIAEPDKIPRIAMHGVRKELLEAQARAIGLPLETIELPDQPSMQAYETALTQKLNALSARSAALNTGSTPTIGTPGARNITHGIYGDIFLEDLRQYREQLLDSIGITPMFPLWQQSSDSLINEFLDAGFKAIVVCVDAAKLDQTFCGRLLDRSFVNDLPWDIDPCGENGEFHTFVFDGPIFDHPVPFDHGKYVYKELRAAQAGKPPSGFHFCDLLHPINV